MNELREYNRRLAVFAAHIKTIKIKKHPRSGQYKICRFTRYVRGQEKILETRIHAWLFDDLPMLFENYWYYNHQKREPVLCDQDQLDLFNSVSEFFALDTEEFEHLFDINGMQQISRYGGQFILDFTEADRISGNISELIKYRLHQESGQQMGME